MFRRVMCIRLRYQLSVCFIDFGFYVSCLHVMFSVELDNILIQLKWKCTFEDLVIKKGWPIALVHSSIKQDSNRSKSVSASYYVRLNQKVNMSLEIVQSQSGLELISLDLTQGDKLESNPVWNKEHDLDFYHRHWVLLNTCICLLTKMRNSFTFNQAQ